VAYDPTLRRDVWLKPAGAEPISPMRREVARPARLRWLATTLAQDGQSWDVFESLRGAPLAHVLVRANQATWPPARAMLADLAEELAAALADGTVPERLALDSVWVDQSSQLRLLDAPVGLCPAADEEASRLPPPVRGWRLFQQAVALVIQRVSAPGHAIDFAHEVAALPPSPGNFEWAIKQLELFESRQTPWNWDDRLGVLSISVGMENTIFYTAALFGSLLVVHGFPQFGMVGGTWVVWLLLQTAAWGLGTLLRGGPAFRFAGVQVRQIDGRPASPLRCGLRNAIAWVPALAAFSLFGMAVSQVTAPFDSTADTMARDFLVAFWMLIALVPLSVYVAGSVISVVFPRRGIVDRLVLTYLVPK
jgi:hypothetical protein